MGFFKREHSRPIHQQAQSNEPFIRQTVMAKLKMGTPGDQFEKEADATADKVVNKTSGGAENVQAMQEEEKVQKQPIASGISSVQKKDLAGDEKEPVQAKSQEEEPVQAKGEEEEPVQMMEEDADVQRQEEGTESDLQAKAEEEEPVQKMEEEADVQRQEEGTESDLQAKSEDEEKKPVQAQTAAAPKPKAASSIESKLKGTKGNGQKLSGKAKREMEAGFGADFSNVNIHTDAKAAEMSDQIGAQAFTHGNDVYFNQGKYDPSSMEGKALLAHELTHTIQQEGATEKEASTSNETSIEKDADDSTMSFMQRMLSGGKEAGKKIMPKLKGGLRISRCQGDKNDKSGVIVGDLTQEAIKNGAVGDDKKKEDSEYEKWKAEHAPNVKGVKSLKLLTLAENKKTAEADLAYRKQKRIETINKAIDNIETYMTSIGKRPEAEENRLKLLKSDLIKTDEEIKSSEDASLAQDLNKDRRLKILASFETIKSIDAEIVEATKNWREHDADFVGSEDLMLVLNEIHMTPADIKALIGQESGDLMASDEELKAGDKAGIAQIGANETTSVGHDAEERKDPKKAILITAKVLKSKISDAGLVYGNFSDPKDYKSMAFAAYNAGGNAVKQSLIIAESEKKSTTSWSALIAGDKDSPLYKGLQKTYAKSKVDSKFTEVKNYITYIFKRLP